MIEVHKHGKTVRFDDTGVDRKMPGGIRHCLYRGRFYEEAFLDHIRSIGRRGVYVDVGSFIGTHALYFAMLCDSTRVYAVEPRPVPAEELARNLAVNGMEAKVTIVKLGVAAEKKTVKVHIHGEDAVFECVPLDDIVAEPDVAVIKIDVEGMELDVLRGAQRILRESKPVIFAEAHSDAERLAMEDYLRPFDYVWDGRVHNTSPTYEFIHVADPFLRDLLAETVAHRDRTEAARLMRRNERLELDNVKLRDVIAKLEAALEKNVRRLAVARRSLPFRLSRATAVALRESITTPWHIPARWLETFTGPDEVLEAAEQTARKRP